MLNRVWELMKHSLIIGTQESFVDTPTREKGGFLGDSWTISTSAMAAMGERTMSLRVLKEFLTSQDQYWPDGRLNAVYPNGDGKRDIPDYTQMYLFWVWDYYIQTGNKGFLQDHFDQLQKVAAYIYSCRNNLTGLIHNLTGGSGAYLYGIVDWPATMRYGYDMSTEARTVINAYAYLDFKIMARISEVLDDPELHASYTLLADGIKQAINENLINSEGIYIDGLSSDLAQSTHASQHANMLPLAMGIVPGENIDKVIETVKSKQMSVGMVTLKWLPEALGESEEGEHLVDLYTNAEWDGWAKTITLGATATWESWDALSTGQSLSHPWGAAGIHGIIQYILGIKPLQPQHALIQVKPLGFGEKLSHAEGTIPTDRGPVSVSWESANNQYNMTLEIPANMKARVYIPAGESESSVVLVNDREVPFEREQDHLYVGEFGSGTYTFSRQPSNTQSSSLDLHDGNYRVYPNPARDEVTVDLGKQYENVRIEIRDISGQIRKERKFTDARFCNFKIDPNHAGAGIVMLTIYTGEGIPATLKLAKSIG
jgi:alpha-L-rhamnosidase